MNASNFNYESPNNSSVAAVLYIEAVEGFSEIMISLNIYIRSLQVLSHCPVWINWHCWMIPAQDM